MSEKKIITRIAPSPTGNFHVGTARSALFNYLFARHHGGNFIVRIEDTDKARSTKEFEKNILDGLAWLGLDYEALYRQSENTDRYTDVIKTLIESGKAYISKEPSKQDESVKVEVVRLKNPNKDITFNDKIRGDITFNTTDLGDFVIARSINDPLYHLTVVVDDHDMEITHVIRGEDHISNTPRQILIQEALDFERPIYAHLPLILAPDRSKLSKRKGETSVSVYAKDFLPEALVNYLALLGWNPGTEQEIFTMTELIKQFSLEKIVKGGAIFDIEKLKSINATHIKKLPKDVFLKQLISLLPNSITNSENYSIERLALILPHIQERIRTFADVREMIEANELDFYFNRPDVSKESIVWKDETTLHTKEYLDSIISNLETIPETNFTAENIKNKIWEYATEKGRGSVLWPMRFALSGMEKSPDPFSIGEILGKEEAIQRLKNALAKL